MRFPSASICALAAICASLSVGGTAAAEQQQQRTKGEEDDAQGRRGGGGGRPADQYVQRANNAVGGEEVHRRLAKKRNSRKINGVKVTTDEDGSPALEGRYLFTGAAGDSTGKVKSICQRLRTKMGVTDCEVYEHVGVGSFAVPPKAGRGNRAKENKFVERALSGGGVLSGLVENIDADTTVYVDAIQEDAIGRKGLWGLDFVDGTDDDMHTFEQGRNASNVYIVIIDTGIRCSHQEFSGSHVTCTNVFVAPRIKSRAGDENGHGTHCAGTAIGKTTGVAKGLQGANLWSFQVLDRKGYGSWSGIVAALDKLKGIAELNSNSGNHYIASLSLGGGRSGPVDSAVNALANLDNAHVVVAAGNADDDTCDYSPAGAAKAITVGSVTSSNKRSYFSNYGKCVDLFAPGSNVYSSWRSSDTAYKKISGTSMAAPHVAGAIAVLLAAELDVDGSLYRNSCGIRNMAGTRSPDKCVTTEASLTTTGPSSLLTTTTTTAATTTTTQSTPSVSCDGIEDKGVCKDNLQCAYIGKGRNGECVNRDTCGPNVKGVSCSGDQDCQSCICKGERGCA